MSDRMVQALHFYNTGDGLRRAEIVDIVQRVEILERAIVDHVLLWDHTVDDATFMANVEHSVAQLRRLVGSHLADVKAGIDPWRMKVAEGRFPVGE